MSEWPMVKLGELGKWAAGGTPSRLKAEYFGGIIPWASIADLNDGFVSMTMESITELGLQNSSAKIYPKGSILIAMYGSIGKLGINVVPMASNQAIACFMPNETLERDYAFWALYSLRSELIMIGRGGTQKNIGQGILKEQKIPLPPLGEQKRIAEILGGVSKAIQILEHELQLLGEISVLEQQNNLSTQKLSDLVTIRSGTVDPTLSVNRNLPHIAPDSIEKNTGRILQIRSCEEDKVTSGKYHFYKGDVLYSKIRPYLNKVVIAPFEGLCSADMYALRPKEGINSEVLQALLMSKDFLAYAEQWSGRASIPKINRKALLAYNVPKMTDKQVNEVKAKIQSIHKVVELKCRKLSLLQELQKSLATRAFAGLL